MFFIYVAINAKEGDCYEIVGSMNVDDIPMGEYCIYVTMMICYIHD